MHVWKQSFGRVILALLWNSIKYWSSLDLVRDLAMQPTKSPFWWLSQMPQKTVETNNPDRITHRCPRPIFADWMVNDVPFVPIFSTVRTGTVLWFFDYEWTGCTSVWEKEHMKRNWWMSRLTRASVAVLRGANKNIASLKAGWIWSRISGFFEKKKKQIRLKQVGN